MTTACACVSAYGAGAGSSSERGNLSETMVLPPNFSLVRARRWPGAEQLSTLMRFCIIVDFSMHDDKFGIALKGKCKKCGKDVARLVEDG